MTRRRLLQSGRLPSGYKEVQYLKSHGTEYIDTLFKPTQNTKIEIRLPLAVSDLPPSTDSSYVKNLFGTYEEDKYTYIRLGYLGPNKLKIIVAFGSVSRTITDTFVNDDTVYHIIQMYMENTKLVTYFPIGNYKDTSQGPVGTFSGEYSIPIFCQYDAVTGEYRRYFEGRISEFKIWESGVIQRDLVACYRRSDSEAGMYDIVNNMFYTNQGTGEFDIG